MKQIDQHPREYRAQPLKGEPVFKPGGVQRLGVFGLVLLIGLVASVVTYPVYWLTCTYVTKTCVSSEQAP